MTIQQIAERLVALCRDQKWEQAQTELFAAEAVSIEPYPTPGFDLETKGLPAIVEKGRRFSSTVETMHSLSVGDAIVATESFACIMEMDVTMKGQGRMKMAELCVYKVKDGKVISEQFFV